MGKSGGRKKKSGVGSNQNQNQDKIAVEGNNSSAPVANGGQNFYTSVILQKAHEMKEEGNRKFQEKDYVGALQLYENALKLAPRMHPDRAIFHSNRAACLMQIKPIDYEAVITECTLSLQVQPSYVRALLRRARAYEAIGKLDMAMHDVQLLLAGDPNHRDALEITRRLRMALGPRQDAQQDLQSRPSPAALGASAVGAPIPGLGPCLPARPVSSKKSLSSVSGQTVPSPKSEKLYPVPTLENGPQLKTQMPKVVLKPSSGSSVANSDSHKSNQSETLVRPFREPSAQTNLRYRPLKLVYDHDIRLAQMPVNCSFKVLREVVSARFPISKSVLIKYKDSDGDLITITSSAELRYAESTVEKNTPKDLDSNKEEVFPMLKFHIVEVSPEQEPQVPEEEDVTLLEVQEPKVDENVSHSSTTESSVDAVDSDAAKTEKTVQKAVAPEDPEFKEVEMDDWLFEFAQLFRSRVGIDPDAHIELHEIGMEMCSEALEETVTSEDAQGLFDKAALKFQEVAALAFFNWGNVHMCAARKKIPIDESAGKDVMEEQLKSAYDWVKEKYNLAREKYEQSLAIKPDFYEGLLALGQQQFEMAKLQWSFVLAKKVNLSEWDPTETLNLFDNAEVKLKAATEMWEKLEEERLNELKNPSQNKTYEQLLKRRKKQGDLSAQSDSSVIPGEMSPEEAAEQAAIMRSQIQLFCGNMLFERSQIECKLGLPGWKKNLDIAAEQFKLAGASETDVSTVLKNHCSNEQVANGNNKRLKISLLMSLKKVRTKGIFFFPKTLVGRSFP